MAARISVVVPMYNVESYLDACLTSIGQQTVRDLEVVMVDDGSSDGTAAIARRHAEQDARFVLVTKPNGGLGSARNAGIDAASGEFLAFVDSDDLLPRHAYEVLLRSLDETGSDFACGNVRRLAEFGTRQANFLSEAFDTTRLRTHVTEFPALLADRISVNKLWRRSFWDAHSLRFPEGVLYEDIPVTVPAHFLAHRVDVIATSVYLWRIRPGDDASITQSRTLVHGIENRVRACLSVSRFLADRGLEDGKRRYDRSVLADDLSGFRAVLDVSAPDYQQAFLDHVNRFLDQADPAALASLPAIDRLVWELVRRRALPELLDVLDLARNDLPARLPQRQRGELYGDYPFRGDPRLGIPDDVYRLDSELVLRWAVDDWAWRGGTLHLDGHAAIDWLGAPQRDSQQVQLRAVGPEGRTVDLTVEPVQRPDVTTATTTDAASRDWAGFHATLAAEELGELGRRDVWRLELTVAHDRVTRRSDRPEVRALRPLPAVRGPRRAGRRLVADVQSDGRLVVQTVRPRTVIRSCLWLDGVLQLEGELAAPPGRPELVVERRIGAVTLRYPAFVDETSAGRSFLARIPLGDLTREYDTADEQAHTEQAGEGAVWDLRLGGARLSLPPGGDESRCTYDGREFALHRTRSGTARLVERSHRPVVAEVDWADHGWLHLSGSFAGPAGDYHLVLGARRRVDSYSFGVDLDATTGRFAVELDPAAVATMAGTVPLPAGAYEMTLRPRGAADDGGDVSVEPRLVERFPLERRVAGKLFRLGVGGRDNPVLQVSGDLPDTDRGAHHQRRLRTVATPAMRRQPLHDAVLYDARGGGPYAGSPRAVHEELVRRGAGLEHLWAVSDGAFPVPATARAVKVGSEEFYDAYARARFLVSDDYWPEWFVRRPDQVGVQTWHGTPLKRFGLDLADRYPAHRELRRAQRQDPASWHYVASAGPLATAALRRSLPDGIEIVASGLPASDLVTRPERHTVRSDVRERLGIAAGTTVVFYAPTYRDQLHGARGRFRMGPVPDLAVMRAALGDDHVVLFRRHPLVSGAVPADGRFVVDVSLWPDPADLVLAADVLVTDYSSTVFSALPAGRPVLFYAPDLAAYRDEIRGLQVDLLADGPGPVLATTAELVTALRELGGFDDQWGERYRRFTAAHCPCDDGGAAGRLVDTVFEEVA